MKKYLKVPEGTKDFFCRMAMDVSGKLKTSTNERLK